MLEDEYELYDEVVPEWNKLDLVTNKTRIRFAALLLIPIILLSYNFPQSQNIEYSETGK